MPNQNISQQIPCALLINDIHVSKDNVIDFHANWDEAINICKNNNIPEIIVGGDLWQSRSAQTLNTLLAVRQAIMKATSNGIDVTLAEGNHDKVDQESLLGYSHIFSEYPNVYVVDDYTALEYGDNLVLYIMSYFPENGSFEQKLNSLLTNGFDNTKHNILYIHQGINGVLATSSDKELPTKIFKDFDKVLVGHYHDRCVITGTNIEYIGSSRQHNFGEDENKGYTVVYEDGSYSFIQNQANIRFRTIDITPDQINDSLLCQLENAKESGKVKIKARISCSQAEASTIDRQQLIESGISRIEVVSDIEIAENNIQHSLDQKFDKNGIKEEYSTFCVNKEISSEMGIKYLDQIQ